MLPQLPPQLEELLWNSAIVLDAMRISILPTRIGIKAKLAAEQPARKTTSAEFLCIQVNWTVVSYMTTPWRQ
jgi:hypothetical protein